MIPKNIRKNYCNNKIIMDCDYYLDTDCPATCPWSKRMDKGIRHQTDTGLERFVKKYGYDWMDRLRRGL